VTLNVEGNVSGALSTVARGFSFFFFLFFDLYNGISLASLFTGPPLVGDDPRPFVVAVPPARLLVLFF